MLLISPGGLANGAAAARKNSRATCSTQGRTIAATARVRVFRVRRSDQIDVYACVLPRGDRQLIGVGHAGLGGVGLIRIAGIYVGSVESLCDSHGCEADIAVTNARTGFAQRSDLPSDSLGVSALVIASTGSFAWIQRRAPDNGPMRYEVVMKGFRGRGTADVVASGADIVPGSLALAGGRIYWQDSAGAHSTLLSEAAT